MPRLLWPVLILAGAAILLPWERCHGACHDGVAPLGGEHDCHGKDCPPAPEDEPDHDVIETLLIAPDAPVPADLPTTEATPEMPEPDAFPGSRVESLVVPPPTLQSREIDVLLL